MQSSKTENSDYAIVIPPPGAPGSYLAGILADNPEGRIIVKSYLYQRGFLNSTARKLLVHLIIQTEVNKALLTLSCFGKDQLQDFSITSATLNSYSQEIAVLFPSEDPEGYFSQFRTVNGVRKDTTGRLWDHFNYIKSVLKDHGVLVRASRDNRNRAAKENLELDGLTLQKIKWLEKNEEPRDHLSSLWSETFEARRAIISKEKKSLPHYYAQFLGIRSDDAGPDLIQDDFGKLYPGEFNALDAKWDMMKDHLIAKVTNSKNIKEIRDQALVLLLPTLSRDQQVSTLFHLIPAMTPQERFRKQENSEEKLKNNNQRITLQERRDSFTLRIPADADLKTELSKIRELRKRNGHFLEPTPITVGTVLDVQACYVAVNDSLYRVNRYIEAIDLAFKIYHVTSCDYPDKSKSLWQFVQKAIYCIDDKNEKFPSWVKFLAGELKTVVARKTESS